MEILENSMKENVRYMSLTMKNKLVKILRDTKVNKLLPTFEQVFRTKEFAKIVLQYMEKPQTLKKMYRGNGIYYEFQKIASELEAQLHQTFGGPVSKLKIIEYEIYACKKLCVANGIAVNETFRSGSIPQIFAGPDC